MKLFKKMCVLVVTSGIVGLSGGPVLAQGTLTVGSQPLAPPPSPQRTIFIESGFSTSFQVPNDPDNTKTKLFYMEVLFNTMGAAPWPQPPGVPFTNSYWPIVTGDGSGYTTTITGVAVIGYNNGSGPWGYDLTATIDPQPGSETVTLPTVATIKSITIKTECIPEPTTFGLMALGALALLMRRQRKV